MLLTVCPTVIILSVISYNGASGNGQLTASFDELGGSIGRADTNQLVLPDPDRAISRVHAQVVFRAGAYAIVDRGSNPILVNGQPVGSGREALIKEGDQVQIGGFVLSVKQPAAAARKGNTGDTAASFDDPFAGLLGPAVAARSPTGNGSAGLIDPLAASTTSSSVAASGNAVSAASAGSGTFAASTSAAGGIPDDWDPFAPSPVAARTPVQDFAQSLGRKSSAGQFGLDSGSAAPAALIADLHSGVGNDNSLDALFGLKPGTGGGDPLANSVLDAAMSKPNMAASNDPLKSLGSAPLASGQAAQDNLSDLQLPFIAPPVVGKLSAVVAVVEPVAPTPAIAATSLVPVVAPIIQPPAGKIQAVLPAMFSWDAPEGDGHTVIRPGGRSPAATIKPVIDIANVPDDDDGRTQIAPATQPNVPAVPVVAAAPASSPASPAPTVPASADVAALLAAFLDGLDVPNLKLEALTPELMRLIGLLLHESARGTVDLLVARAALKREVRAEATMIVVRENNPLKFSPSAEAALQHLLSPPIRGFMAPGPAMRDAFDDLRAHQFGFIAGMRAALAGVLQRFKPSELEGRLTQRSGLKSLLPGSRKAAMWDVFTEHYAQIGREAEDDFHTLFGKAFLQAYEEHILQLKKDTS